jgi:Tfp pilus assembly protein PilF
MRRKLNVRLLLWTVAALVPAAVAVHFVHGYQVRRNAEVLLQRGDQELEQGRPDQALVYYGQYLGFVPGDTDAQEKYVRLLDRLAPPGDRIRVVLLMQRLLLERPELHDLRFRLIHNLIAVGRIGDAAQQINALRGRWGEPAELTHMLGWCQEAREQYADAVKSFQEAVRLDPKRLDSYALWAEVLSERLGEPVRARQVLDEMVQANPKAYRAYLIRARYLLRQGDEAAADKDVEAALSLDGRQPDVVLAAADRLLARDKATEAYALLQTGAEHNPLEAALYKAMADLKIRAGDRAGAVEVLARGLQKLPQAADLLVLQTDLLIDQGKLSEATGRLKELEKLNLPPTLPDYLRARIAIAAGRWAEATTLLERCRKELGPNSGWSSRVSAQLGVCYRQAGDGVRELAAFRRAVQDEPGWAAARAGLGAALLDGGRVEEAVAELELAQRGYDVPPELWAVLGRALLYRNLRLPEDQRDWAGVESALARAREAQPEAQAVAVLEAELLAARKDFAAARAVLEKARDRAEPGKSHERAALWCALVDLAEQQGHTDEADRILERAEQELGDCLDVRLARCRLWGGRGTAEARRGLAGLSDGLDRFDAAARDRLRHALAETWARLGDWGRAEALWLNLAADRPQDLRSRFALLEGALQANQPDKARRLLAELRKLEGAQGMLWRYGTAALRVWEARADRAKLAEARKVLDELARQQPDWGRVPLLQARADELDGQLGQAARHYERAIELGEAQPGVVRRLLELLLDRQEYLRAEEALGRFLQAHALTPALARLGAEVAAGNRNGPVARARGQQAAPLPSNDYRDYLWLARIHQAIGEPAEAENLLREAVRIADHAPDPWVALIEYLDRTGQSGAAEQALAQARAKLPASVRPLALARGHEALHQAAKAEADYAEALAAAPGDFVALAQAAEFFARQDRPDRAEPLLRKLLEPAVAAPDGPAARARRQLAAILATRGPDGRTEALDLLTRNTKEHGDTPADERVRWYVTGQDPAKLARAIAQFQESLERQPPSPSERLLLAELCLAAGKAGQARAALQPLLAQPAPQPVARYVAALIRAGDLDEATAWLARLEQWEPQTPRTHDLREALAKARAGKQ